MATRLPLKSCGLTLTALPLALCLSGAILLCAAQVWLPGSGLPPGHTMQACATWRISSPTRMNFAVSWRSPNINSAPQKMFITRRYSCAFLPWSPSLPEQGAFLIMP